MLTDLLWGQSKQFNLKHVDDVIRKQVSGIGRVNFNVLRPVPCKHQHIHATHKKYLMLVSIISEGTIYLLHK